MSSLVDAQGAVHDSRGRYATKNLGEADLTLAPAAPGPVGSLDDRVASDLYCLASGIQLDHRQARPMTAADFDNWLARDMPGLDRDERRRLTEALVHDMAQVDKCIEAQRASTGDRLSAVYRIVPRELRDRVSPIFTVEDVDGWYDPDTGKLEGHVSHHFATGYDWAVKLEGVAVDDVKDRLARARAFSDARTPGPEDRFKGISDPWRTEQVPEPLY